ncbi:fasciclin domain-containing protein [Micromonospora cathayae]|uniref:Fasciclin domain-containing protein n=1 Tax=Micromonospora cathayae TaxID=3028804 RepID=A0ABY7ZR46_9ACTN|nr:fasciclin domain-containing protein [Micromonospora sp. HUAS 3]WDZ84687.1 fasciclin domain-containing protein [Micromonospora sp. HUAS 3]
MKIARLAARVAAGVAATALVTTAAAAPAQAGTTKRLGTKSLAQVLLADKSGFDHNPRDFDVLTRAVLTVLEAKPNSPVKVLTDGTVALTAFLPTDAAFQQLVRDLTDARRLPSESAAFTAVAGLGVDTVETVLLYHVVPGATIDRGAAVKADGAELTTALGSTVEVDVRTYWHRFKMVRLIDADTDDRDPRVVAFDINKGNRQIAHTIDLVLRPVDLD